VLRKELEKYEGYLVDYFHTGSRVICDPPTKDTDDDWIVLSFPGGVSELEAKLSEDGWELGGSLEKDSNPLQTKLQKQDFNVPGWEEHLGSQTGFIGAFHSYKKDFDGEIVNIIVTISSDYFEKFYKATCIAKDLNLKEKRERVILFEGILRDDYNAFELDGPEPIFNEPGNRW